MGLIHVVFDGKGPPNTLVKKTLEVVINGDKQKLSLESIRSAAIAAVPHTKLSGSTSLTVNMRELTALNFTIENVSFSESLRPILNESALHGQITHAIS